MDPHALAEERSLAYHARVAALIRERPERLEAARTHVEGWLTSGRVHPTYATAWRDRLAGPLDELCAC